RPGLHARRVGAAVGLRQAEAADELAGAQPRQVAPLLRLGAELPDGHAAEDGVGPPGERHAAVLRALPEALLHEAGLDAGQARAAVLLGDRRAEQTHLAHLAP